MLDDDDYGDSDDDCDDGDDDDDDMIIVTYRLISLYRSCSCFLVRTVEGIIRWCFAR